MRNFSVQIAADAVPLKKNQEVIVNSLLIVIIFITKPAKVGHYPDN